jgi:competence protein ComEC
MASSSSEHSFAPYPLSLICAAFAAGILIGQLTQIPLPASIVLTGAATLLIVLLLRLRKMTAATFVVLIASTGCGIVLETNAHRPLANNRIKFLILDGTLTRNRSVELLGVVEQPLEYLPDGFYLTVRAERLRLHDSEVVASGRIRLLASFRDEHTQSAFQSLPLHCGARVRIVTILERPESFRNPGVASFTDFLDREGFDAIGKIKSSRSVSCVGEGPVFPLLRWLYNWRRRIEVEIQRCFSGETAGVLDAALLGNRYFLSRSAAERFREGGTFHVLVISGLHISFIGGLVLLLVRRFTKRRWLQFAISIAVLWSYTIAVGAEASVVRSALMFSLVALAPLVARRGNSLNALGGAGIVLLMWRPDDLFDPSFQLTVLSVLAIIVIAVPLLQRLSLIGSWQLRRETPAPPTSALWLRTLCETLYWSESKWRRDLLNANYHYRLFKTPIASVVEKYRVQWLLRHSVTALIVSASVQVSLLPLLILYFHRLSVASLFLNIFVSGLMAVLGVVALVALVVAQFSLHFAAPFVAVAEGVNWLMVHSVDVFEHAGAHALRLPQYSGKLAALYGLYYLPLVLLVWKLNSWSPFVSKQRSARTMFLAVSHGVMFALLIAHPFSDTHNGRLQIDFLDVGQGDAALVTMPDGTTLMIDAGGRQQFTSRNSPEHNDAEPFERDSRSIGEAVVSEFLWWRGLDRVDYVLATHADADHIDGLNDVVNNFNVRSALVARTPSADTEYVKFAATLSHRATPINIIGAGDTFHFGDVTVTVLWPPLENSADAPSQNNDSIVMRVSYGNRSFLMTGDVEKEGEAAILHSAAVLASDVVKVPHHGSKTSSTDAFVQSSHPQFAVISVGLISMFGHPRPEVVERWQAAGARVMTTGGYGTITISTDGTDLRLDSFIK